MLNYALWLLKIYAIYHVKVLDISFECIIVLSLCHKQTHFCIVIAGIYIPPRSSQYGYNSGKWFNHLACLIARYENEDCFCIMGDFNSWIGGEIHFIDTIDRNTIKRGLINI